MIASCEHLLLEGGEHLLAGRGAGRLLLGSGVEPLALGAPAAAVAAGDAGLLHRGAVCGSRSFEAWIADWLRKVAPPSTRLRRLRLGDRRARRRARARR